MSSSAFPISPQRFAEAILELPLPTLHLKAAEICNSVSHLESSNLQLQPFADAGDKDCADAIKENEDTMLRMEERILMLRREVERRGFHMSDDAPVTSRNVNERPNGHAEIQGGLEDGTESSGPNGHSVHTQQQHSSTDGISRDAASTRTPLERIEGDDEEAEDGMHL